MDSGGDEPQEPPGVGEGGVNPVEFLEGHKHARFFRHVYWLDDTRASRVEPMTLSRPNELCEPCWTACRRHGGCAMLQIFSLKLITAGLAASGGGGGPVEIYGFMAVRDLLDPLRNYVFNRSREDPYLVTHHDDDDPSSSSIIYLSGPKRGVTLQAPVLLEYDMKIKRGVEQDDDVQLVHGVAIFSNKISGRVITTQITGGGNQAAAAVEIIHARFPRALEATVQVRIIELGDTNKLQEGHVNNGGGLDLSITGFVPKIPEDIMLFRGVINEPRELDRFAIAVASNSYLFLRFETRDATGTSHVGRFAFRATPHGGFTDCQKFDFATIEVKATWSNLIHNADEDMM